MTTSTRNPCMYPSLSAERINALVDRAIAEKKPLGTYIFEAVVRLHVGRIVQALKRKHYHGTRQIRMRKGRKG